MLMYSYLYSQNGSDTTAPIPLYVTLTSCHHLFGSYHTCSHSTSPTVWARPGPGSHLSRCVHARLFGPCFKTGRVGCRHRSRPLAPFTWAELRPGGTTHLGRTEDSEPWWHFGHGPGKHLCPEPFPSWARAGRGTPPRMRDSTACRVSLTPSSWLLTRVFRHREVLVSVLGTRTHKTALIQRHRYHFEVVRPTPLGRDPTSTGAHRPSLSLRNRGSDSVSVSTQM